MHLNEDLGNLRSLYSSLEPAQDISPDVELLGLPYGDLDGDRNGCFHVPSIVELTLFPEKRKSWKLIPENDKKLMAPSLIPQLLNANYQCNLILE